MVNQKPDENTVLDKLTDMFYVCVPDEEYLEEDDDTKDGVEGVQNMLDDETIPATDKIRALYSFNSEWFPDGLPDCEQDEYRALLEQADVLLNNA